MNDVRYPELDAAAYAKLRKDLLDVKGSQNQQRFLRAVRRNDEFLAYLAAEVPTQIGNAQVPSFQEPLSEQMYKDPPADIEQEMYGTWRALTPHVACRNTFWAAVTYQHIKDGCIQASYLAANGTPAGTGAERIDLALARSEPKSIDACVRAVIRRMSGLPGVRGNRSVYVNCPLARAWWRERLVESVLRHGSSVERPMVLEVVRTSQEYWERLISGIVSRNSVLGSTMVLDAFVASIAMLRNAEPGSPLRTVNGLVQALRLLSATTASRELGVLEFDEIVELSTTILQQLR